MVKPSIVERFTDDAQHSHWELIDVKSGKVLWSEHGVKDQKAIKKRKLADLSDEELIALAAIRAASKYLRGVVTNIKIVQKQLGGRGNYFYKFMPSSGGLDLSVEILQFDRLSIKEVWFLRKIDFDFDSLYTDKT